MSPHHPLLPLLAEMGRAAREIVLYHLNHTPLEQRIREGAHSGSDVIYAIDDAVEGQLLRLLSLHAEALGGIVLVAEGIGEMETTVHPEGRAECDCAWRLLVDPIDGTRPIMMDKRSAWFLAGAARNRGSATRLSEMECAVMCELPTSRAAVADDFHAVRGQGMVAQRVFLTARMPATVWHPQPWSGPSIRGGFVQMVRFCPPGREHLAALEEEMIARIFPDAAPGEILSFEDQYPSTGGQLVELLCGRDRFNADLRGVLYASAQFRDKRVGHVCHPYDLAGALVAQEAGVRLTLPDGADFDGPLDTRTAMSWVGYPNDAIRAEVEPVLRALLQEKGWLTAPTSSGAIAEHSACIPA